MDVISESFARINVSNVLSEPD